jgi:FAD/FMN-containing dehydrogenase
MRRSASIAMTRVFLLYSREIYGLFKKIKNIFDPKNIFNPGKKVGGSKDYIKSHLAMK